MSAAWRFDGAAGRVAYLGASLAVYSSQHLVVVAAMSIHGIRLSVLPWWYWFNPLRALVFLPPGVAEDSPWIPVVALVATFAADAGLVVLAFRRAMRMEHSAWSASLVIVPMLQVAIVVWLALAPDRRDAVEDPSERAARLGSRKAVTGVMIGSGLIVLTVALSTLVFQLYGAVLFLISPALIAMVVGYLGNRDGAIGFGRTMGLVAVAFLLGGAALLGFAFEGIVCLAMALPIIAVMGLVGAWLGMGLAALGRRGRGTTLASVAFIPILLAAEAVLPPHGSFESVESIDVAAPPHAVWESVVHMGPIPDAPAAPFRWGLAYPMSGAIDGTGVGSIRRGVFSTGVAYERVTEWVPNERLSFDVLSDPPTMREFSPYEHVNAPHDIGYFRTRDARFTLAPLPDGRTRLTLATRHELDLEPALYWTPIAEWAVHANKMRVLAHFQRQAEATVAGR